MWWYREEGVFTVYTKYANNWLASCAQSKGNGIGQLLEEVPFDTSTEYGEIVSITTNYGPLVPITRTYEAKEKGKYLISLSPDGATYKWHPESYDSLARANTIVKKYLRKHYKRIIVSTAV